MYTKLEIITNKFELPLFTHTTTLDKTNLKYFRGTHEFVFDYLSMKKYIKNR